MAWGQYPPPVPAPAAGGPPPEALAGFWRRLVAAFLDWILVGIVASAIGALFGVNTTSPAPVQGDGFQFPFDWAGPYILVELAYFTYFHATSAGQSIGNKILGIRVLDADTGRTLPHARAFVRALMSNLSALPCFLGFSGCSGIDASRPGMTWWPAPWWSGPAPTLPASSAALPGERPGRGAFRLFIECTLTIGLIIQTILLDPSGADQTDAEHPSRNRKVVGSNPTSGLVLAAPARFVSTLLLRVQHGGRLQVACHPARDGGGQVGGQDGAGG